MGVYIKNMEMPKEGSWTTVRIYPDGTCAVPNWQGDCTLIKGTKAVPVPPHGRLGDLDVLVEKAWDADTRCGYVQVVDVGDILDAPTIIPAEEGE